MKRKFKWILVPFLVLLSGYSFAQEKSISGNVTDEDGLPLLKVFP
ncbi:hypothetical protein [Zobellia laminariae]|nr:hypothetical protein [Zobellia laminariae]WKX77348.1 hypothetical protein Q5W13_04610 [Zobellia laminariae]